MYAFVGFKLLSIIFWNYNKRSRMNYEFLYRIILSKMLRYATVSSDFHRIFIENGEFWEKNDIRNCNFTTMVILFWSIVFLFYLFNYLKNKFSCLFRGIILYKFIGSILHLPHWLLAFQTDVLSSPSDWSDSALPRFDWLRASFSKHQLEKLPYWPLLHADEFAGKPFLSVLSDISIDVCIPW